MEIFKENANANFFLDEMPFDDVDPDLNHNNHTSLLDLDKIVGIKKCLWAACRNQSKPIKKQPGFV